MANPTQLLEGRCGAHLSGCRETTSWGGTGRASVAVFGRWAPDWFAKELLMNWDRIEGNWKQFTGRVKEQWGKLTDDDIDVIAGKRDQLVGKIQEQYGITKDEAEKQVDRFGDSFRDEDLRTYQ
jgi:uncharacterized protein YjbJ (UPF0337 family)